MATVMVSAAVFFIGPAAADGAIHYSLRYEGPRDADAVGPLLVAQLVRGSSTGYGYGYGYGSGYGYGQSGSPPAGHGYGHGYGYGYGNDGPIFGGLDAGEYRVLGFADLDLDREPTTEEPQAYGVDAAGETLFHLGHGERLRVDVVVREAGSNVTGLVVDADGAPISNASVTLVDRFGWSLATSTDTDGVFLVLSAPTGIDHTLRYQAFVNASGFIPYASGLVHNVTRDAYDLGTIRLTQAADVDTARPTVLAHSPRGVDVPLTSAVTLTFSEAMDAASVASALRVEPALSAPLLVWSGDTVIVTSGAPLDAATNYHVSIAESATDVAGNALVPMDWTFSTAAATPDDARPVVIAHSPTGDKVPPGQPIEITFSEPMDAASVLAALRVTPALAMPLKVDQHGNTFEIRGHRALLHAQTYQVTLDASAKSLRGPTQGTPFVWSFSTAPGTAPEIADHWPLGWEVPTDTTLGIVFSRAMDRESVERALTISPQPHFPSSITWNGNTMILSGTRIWIPGTTYDVRLDGSARDAAHQKLGEDIAWSFTTTVNKRPDLPETEAPTILRKEPTGNHVYPGSRISIRFSEPMDQASVAGAISITPALPGPLKLYWTSPGAFAIRGAEDLEPSTTYRVELGRSAHDYAGNGLAGENVWTFTTAPRAGARDAPVPPAPGGPGNEGTGEARRSPIADMWPR